jgi:hypothetical protein
MRSSRAIAAMLCAVLCTGLAAGCSSDNNTAPVMVASGTTAGVGWYLWAWDQSGTLCMSTGTPVGPDGGNITPAPRAMSGGGCGFDRKTPDGGYYVGAQGGGSGTGQFTASLSFGPLPDQATQIKVASDLVLATRLFPLGKGLAPGRFWVWAGAVRPPAAIGTVLDTPQPLNAEGQAVAFQDF